MIIPNGRTASPTQQYYDMPTPITIKITITKTITKTITINDDRQLISENDS